MRISLSDQRVWYTILTFSVAIRLVTAPFTGHPYDLGIWMMTGSYVGLGRSPYDLNPHIGYPPLWALWCGVSYMISNFMLPKNQFAYIFTIKIPILFADFALAAMILQIGLRNSKLAAARALATLYLLNPYVLTVGVIWGMMDNLVGILVIASIISIKDKPYWSGFFLAIGFTLKFYPILFLPLILASVTSRQKFVGFARWIAAFLVTSLTSIWIPFLFFDWNTTGFTNVGISQISRNPGAIAPIAISTYLIDIGITSIGPVSLETINDMQMFRLLWIPAILLTLLLILRRKRISESQSMIICGCSVMYIVYLLTAPWISEQLFELTLIFMLFQGALTGLRRFSYASYAFGSAIVFIFLSLHAPITSFIFPLYQVDNTILLQLAKPLLAWILLVFGGYLVLELIREEKTLRTLSH